jgi:hypothetical protein
MFPCNTKVSLLSCVFTTHSVFFLFFEGWLGTMPNKYVRRIGSRKYADYTEDTLAKAILDMKMNKLTYRMASDKYQISKSTRQRKCNEKI